MGVFPGTRVHLNINKNESVAFEEQSELLLGTDKKVVSMQDLIINSWRY